MPKFPGITPLPLGGRPLFRNRDLAQSVLIPLAKPDIMKEIPPRQRGMGRASAIRARESAFAVPMPPLAAERIFEKEE